VQYVPAPAEPHDLLLVPFGGREIAIPSNPPELLPLLAKSGRYGLTLVGEPVPDANLARVACPRCNRPDVSWLSLEDGSNLAHCDLCDCDFEFDDKF
jgi:hypothetical protein